MPVMQTKASKTTAITIADLPEISQFDAEYSAAVAKREAVERRRLELIRQLDAIPDGPTQERLRAAAIVEGQPAPTFSSRSDTQAAITQVEKAKPAVDDVVRRARQAASARAAQAVAGEYRQAVAEFLDAFDDLADAFDHIAHQESAFEAAGYDRASLADASAGLAITGFGNIQVLMNWKRNFFADVCAAPIAAVRKGAK